MKLDEKKKFKMTGTTVNETLDGVHQQIYQMVRGAMMLKAGRSVCKFSFIIIIYWLLMVSMLETIFKVSLGVVGQRVADDL